jgi:tetratricopeptide (TPR) repeat protein
MRLLTAIIALVLANGAFAADTPGASSSTSDPLMERYQAAAAKQDWKSAAATMQEAIGGNSSNADYHNLYAYALRKGGSQGMDLVFKHYNEALRIDPKHRGAHEYIGEAYLMVGNVGKAKEHLGQLDKLCFFGCTEYNDLKKAISTYETKSVK